MKRLISLLVVTSISLALLGLKRLPEFSEHMEHLRQMTEHMSKTVYEESQSHADKTPLSGSSKKTMTQDLEAMILTSKNLQKDAYSRGAAFDKRLKNFEEKLNTLKKQIAKANVHQAKILVSEVALTCGNCHSCEVAHEELIKH